MASFIAYASVFNNTDRNKEAVDPGAFTLTLRESGGEFPLLWQHDMSEPIGVVSAREDHHGLLVNGSVNVDVPAGQKAWHLLTPPPGFKRGGVASLSIGYRVDDDAFKGGVRHLRQISLFEVSFVTVPANSLARIIKLNADEKAFADELEHVEQASANGIELSEMLQAMRDYRMGLSNTNCSHGDDNEAAAFDELKADITNFKNSLKSTREKDEVYELASLRREMQSYNRIRGITAESYSI